MSNELPSSEVEVVSGTVGGFGAGLDNICVIGPSSAGPLFAPRVVASAKAEIDTFGYGEAAEIVARIVRRTRKKSVRVRVPATTAGAVARTNSSGVLGSSVITVTGTPHRRYDLVFEVIGPGVIATDGITFRYSLNGGVTWTPETRLGTANTYTIPRTGLTLNFAAGDLDAGDRFTAHATGPEGSVANYGLAIAALIEFNVRFRVLIITGEFSASEATELKNHIDTLYAAGFQPIVFIGARDWYPDAEVTGSGTTLAFANANPDTITRVGGSFITDGFRAGMTITVAGSTSNNGVFTVASVGALVLTLSGADSLTVEAAATGRTITGEETETTWIASLLADLGTWEDARGRVVISAGQTWMVSEVDQLATRVPVYLPAVERWMSHDIQVAPHRKGDGELAGYSVYDPQGVVGVVEHDARTNNALNASRFLTARTYTNNPGQTFLSLSSTMGPPGSAFGHFPWVAVSNLYAEVVQRVTEDFIGDDPITKDDGTLEDEELARYKEIVEEELTAELLSPKTEGPRASAVSWTPSDTDIVNVPNATLNGEGVLRTRGLIGSVRTRVVVNASEE
jgi:hypothetical protein